MKITTTEFVEDELQASEAVVGDDTSGVLVNKDTVLVHPGQRLNSGHCDRGFQLSMV